MMYRNRADFIEKNKRLYRNEPDRLYQKIL